MGEKDRRQVAAKLTCSGLLTSSPTMVCMTPMFPFSAPPNSRPAKAIQMFEANPSTTMLNIVPTQPNKSTGFRPMRSDNVPQYIPITASARAKDEMSKPE